MSVAPSKSSMFSVLLKYWNRSIADRKIVTQNRIIAVATHISKWKSNTSTKSEEISIYNMTKQEQGATKHRHCFHVPY